MFDLDHIQRFNDYFEGVLDGYGVEKKRERLEKRKGKETGIRAR